jgi:hypothetical protein
MVLDLSRSAATLPDLRISVDAHPEAAANLDGGVAAG